MILTLAFAVLLALPACVSAGDFTVQRGDCAGVPADSDWNHVEASWLGSNTLRITAWDTETQTRRIADDSGVADVRPGLITLSYELVRTTLPEGAPVVFCEDFVRVVFTVKDLPNDEYRIILNNGEGTRESSAGANSSFKGMPLRGTP